MGVLKDLVNSLIPDEPQEDIEQDEEEYYEPDSDLSDRDERIINEVEMIAPRFRQGGIEFDEANCDWVIINDFALPEKWEQRWARLMILFPSAYPDVPPIGFYLDQQFNLKDGGRDNHFTGQAHDGAPDLQEDGWHWYCVRIADGAWQPQADYTKSDNLWSYLAMIRESLTNDF